jgi:predicted ATP-dependent endonuclease of OLD family
MHIRKINLRNIRAIRNFTWQLEDSRESMAGLHILIGDNGTGKSTVLRAIALTLVGAKEAYGLRETWSNWITFDQSEGSIELLMEKHESDKYTGRGRTGNWDKKLPLKITIGKDVDSNETTLLEPEIKENVTSKNTEDTMSPKRHVWGGGQGWFSASFGPFRRFSGGSPDRQKLFYANRRLAAHLSVFDENIALSEIKEWLIDLHLRRLENDGTSKRLLDALTAFINHGGLFPHDTTLDDITSRGIIFRDANRKRVDMEQLSDGYRSVLSMIFEIIRQLSIFYPDVQLFSPDYTQIVMPGVILIDEIDSHLHPSWQRTIGRWLIEHFPNMQFIVTTHSPLVCQAAVNGSIWRLPAPGDFETGYRISKDDPKTSEEWKRLVYGNILEAYSTDLFGENIDRSPEAQEKFERLAELSVKELDEPLLPTEREEFQQLIDELPSTLSSTELTGVSNND